MMPIKLLFCGDRNWTDAAYIYNVMHLCAYHLPGPLTIIEGEANGADKLAAQAATTLCLPVERYPADWIKYGKAAGPIRNNKMLTFGRPSGVLAFHNNLASSKGTRHMVTQARKANIPVWTSQEGQSAFYMFLNQVIRSK